MNKYTTILPSLLFFMLVLLPSYEQPPMLDRIQFSGNLLVGIKPGSSTYYHTSAGIDGFEFQLINRLAASLQLTPQFKFYTSDNQITGALLQGDIHMAAGELIADIQSTKLQYSIPFNTTEQILLYRMGDSKPKELADLLNGELEVANGSHQERLLKSIKQMSVPELSWLTAENDHTHTLLSRLNENKIKLTVVSKHEYELNKAYYPYILPAIPLSEKEPIAWGFSRAYDDSLYQAANQFLVKMILSGELATLSAQHLQGIEPKDFVEQRDFWHRTKHQLPKYEQLFQRAADETNMDWLMLAAIGYQESHWDPSAVSPTGVKGIMMLTKAAAKQLHIKDRRDPQQSIVGGARYLVWKAAKIPERIQGDDRLWLTLAAYNVGFGHLEDARILTQRQGGNPDLWEQVKQRLPLLSRKKYYETLKHGKARGQEPVTYVENIRYFHRLLSWYYFQSPERPEA